MKKKTKKLMVRLEDNSAEIDSVRNRLLHDNFTLNELAELKKKLDASEADRLMIHDDVSDALSENNKNSFKRLGAGILLTILIFILCFVCRPLAVLVFVVNLGILGKNLFDADYKNLKEMQAKSNFNKAAINTLKSQIEYNVHSSKKKIKDNVYSDGQLEAIFDNAIRCIESMMEGREILIDSPILKTVVLELLKDDNYPDTTIDELIKIKRQSKDSGKVLKLDRDSR